MHSKSAAVMLTKCLSYWLQLLLVSWAMTAILYDWYAAVLLKIAEKCHT